MEYSKEVKGAEEDALQISINDLLHYVEQTVLLLGQSSNAITYHRELNVLGSFMNPQYQVKSMLKEKDENMQLLGFCKILQKHDEHFCKNMTYSEKSSGTILLTPSNPKNKLKRFL